MVALVSYGCSLRSWLSGEGEGRGGEGRGGEGRGQASSDAPSALGSVPHEDLSCDSLCSCHDDKLKFRITCLEKRNSGQKLAFLQVLDGAKYNENTPEMKEISCAVLSAILKRPGHIV